MVEEKNGGDGGGSGGDEGDPAQLQSEITALKTQLGELETAKSGLTDKNKEYEDILMSDEYAEFVEGKKSGKKSGDDETPKGEDDTDLEKLNSFAPGQLAEFLSEKFGAKLGEMTEASNKKLDQVVNVLVQQAAVNDLERTKLRHGNVKGDEPGNLSLEDKLGPTEGKTAEQQAYYKHFERVAKENASWNGEKVFKQVEMEISAETHSQKQKEDAKAEEVRKAMVEKHSETPLSTVKGKRLSNKEAFDVAWTEHKGNEGVPTE